MKNTGWRTFAVMAAFVVAAGAFAAAQQQAPAKKVNRVPITNTSMASGEEMYKAYCAACHGKDGRGDGPAASAFKTAPTNLTVLSAKNNGKFPEMQVVATLQFGADAKNAHGSKDMPVWGTVFSSLGDQATVKQRIFNLTKYVESLQGGTN